MFLGLEAVFLCQFDSQERIQKAALCCFMAEGGVKPWSGAGAC